MKSVLELLDDLESEDPDVRRMAMEALGNLGPDAPVGSLEVAVEDASPIIRRAATSALAKSGNPDAVVGLVQALGDEDEEVREAAGEGLESIGGEKIADWIIAGDDEADRGELYAEALRTIAHRRAPKFLDGVLAEMIAGSKGLPHMEGETWGPLRPGFNLLDGLVGLEWADRKLRLEYLVDDMFAQAEIESTHRIGVGALGETAWSAWTFERNGVGFVVSETGGEESSYYFIIAGWRPGDNADVRFECVARALAGTNYGFFGWEEPSWSSSFTPEDTSTLVWRAMEARPPDWGDLVSEVKLCVEVELEEGKRLNQMFPPGTLSSRLEVPEDVVERVFASLEEGTLSAADLSEEHERLLVDLFAHLAFM